jgi:hypothetical protein
MFIQFTPTIYRPPYTDFNEANKTLFNSISQGIFLVGFIWLYKINTDSHMLAHANILQGCPDNRYLKLKISVADLTLDSYEYEPVAYVMTQSMVWP